MSDTRTMTLTEFLLARIAEDEADAEIHRQVRGFADLRLERERGAKDQIVRLHLPTSQYTFCISCSDIETPPPNNVEAYPCPTLRALASIYSDHPDFDPAWR